MRTLIRTVMAVLLAVSATPAAEAAIDSGDARVSLLELFTSDECPACPPAEHWFGERAKDRGLWEAFVPVVFHTGLFSGGKDRFSDRKFIDRHRQYTQAWGRRNLYTPAISRDGKEWKKWTAKARVPKPDRRAAGRLKAHALGNGVFVVDFTPAEPERGDILLHAALLGFDAGETPRTRKRGPDRFVAVDYSVNTQASNGRAVVRAEMLLDFRKAAPFRRKGIAVWATRAGDMEPLQAAGGYLD